jgi:arylsulfatase A-like enzyme
VHTPIVPGPQFAGKSANGRYGDWVEEVDWSVGRVLDTLQELELAENTLVLFTSDNGPWLIKESDGGVATPLRGGKGSTWEGGVRVPTVAWWPGTIEAGSVSDTVAGTIDLLPTLVGLSGGEVRGIPPRLHEMPTTTFPATISKPSAAGLGSWRYCHSERRWAATCS